MAQQVHFVELTDEAAELYGRNFIKNFIHNKTYFICEKLHQDSAFLVLEEIQLPEGSSANFEIDLQIPYGFVQYIVSGGRKQVLGFAKQKRADRKTTESHS